MASHCLAHTHGEQWMSSEAARHQLYSKLEHVLGGTEASTLMGYLPPLGWGDVATKDDIRRAEARLEGGFDVHFAQIDVRFSQIETKIAEVSSAVRNQNRNLFVSMLTLQLTAFGLFLAAANLT